MYTSFQLAAKYLKYYRAASNSKGHGMHSPFVFDFILNVLNNGNHYAPLQEIEQLRKKLLGDKRLIEIEELGAGSRSSRSNLKSVSRIAGAALKPRKYGQILYRLARHYQPKTIIELGTSLGITTAYLSGAVPGGKVTTIEGSSAIHTIANANLAALHCRNVVALKGNFDDVLQKVLDDHGQVDLGYIDGNHRYDPTMRYFHQFLGKVNENSILVFDDIHWSEEMEKAWEEIKKHPSVQYTIDIFFLGFVFFKKEFKVKQDFRIRC